MQREQKELNRRIVDLSNRHNIKLIMGCDSHYISPSLEGERDDFIRSKGIEYEDEAGWFLDYPDGDTARQRFIEQGILTSAQIGAAMDNTNVFLQVEEYDKVSCVDLIYRVFDRIGVPLPEVSELIKACPPGSKVWDIYKNGFTIGINQVEQNGTKSRVGKYAPKNISELSAFVAAIRPGFKSMYKAFEGREDFSYGVKVLDDYVSRRERRHEGKTA